MKQFGYLFGVEQLLSLLLLSYPALMLLVKGGMNGVLLFTLLVAVVVTLKHPLGMKNVVWQREWNGYVLAMLSMSAAILLSQLAQQHVTAHPHDAASRFWLAIPVFLLLQRMDFQVFKGLQWAFPLAAILGALLAKDVGGGYTLANMDKIHFGDFELLFGVLSLFSINWFGDDTRAMRWFKILGGLVGIVAAFASGTRGGWLALPIFFGLYGYTRGKKFPFRVGVVTATTVLVIFVTAYATMPTVQSRTDELRNDVLLYQQGNRDTSTGIRWQLYVAAADIFSHHPLLGVGPEGFAQEMQPRLAAGKITATAAELGHGEVHNDLLAKAAGMGLLGLFSLIAIYLVPFKLFLNALRSPIPLVSKTGGVGLVLVSGFFVFGWTVEFMSLTLVTAFYGYTLAVLLAICYNAHHPQ